MKLTANLGLVLLALAAPAHANDPFAVCQERAETARAAIMSGKVVITREHSFTARVALSTAVTAAPEDADRVVRLILSQCLAEENPQ